MNGLELTGRGRGHLVTLAEPPCTLHAAAVGAFLAMRAAARQAGFDLRPLSSFRDFERQRAIWNAKYRGERPALDRRGRPLDMASLTPGERVEAILLWSALPGASRHHWGTDVDVADGGVIARGYQPRLETGEYRRGGAFAALSDWLGRNMQRFGFYRPYTRRGRGVQPEPWHLSFAPVSRQALPMMTVELLAEAIRGSGVQGESEILERLPAILERYVRDVDPPPRMRSRWARLSPRRPAQARRPRLP
ncbi:MAG: M15 family metallopeptidase [Steroidobacteraceae bacterium]|nr:M15 family metallopeptidase [Steroidobacteraceae bacterium]